MVRPAATASYVAIHDDLGVVYMERHGGNNTTNWCSFGDRFGSYRSEGGFYPYLVNPYLTVPVSRETFEARCRRAARK